jgi:hypothetical protein
MKPYWDNLLPRIKTDLLIFLGYHAENGMVLTHLKNTESYFSEFWKHGRAFSQRLTALWETRNDLRSETVSFPLSGFGLDSKAFNEYEELHEFFDWVNVFTHCWITAEDVVIFPYSFIGEPIELIQHPSQPFVDALRQSYRSIVESMRDGKIPWAFAKT